MQGATVDIRTGEIVVTDAIPELSGGPFEATPTGLRVTDRDVPYEVWEAYGRVLKRVEDAIQWVVGDWLNYGERKYGEMYSQALALWPESKYGTLATYAWVARKVEFSIRVENVDWTIHRIVAPLDQHLQKYWLEQVKKHNYSKRDLIEKLCRNPNKDEDDEKDVMFSWAKHEWVVNWMEYRNQMAAWESGVIHDKRDRGAAIHLIRIFGEYHRKRLEQISGYLEMLEDG